MVDYRRADPPNSRFQFFFRLRFYSKLGNLTSERKNTNSREFKRGDNLSLRTGIIGGVIGGVVAAFIGLLVGLLLAPLGVFGITESITTIEGFPVSANFYILFLIIAAIISGIIFGAIYHLLYESIPGETLRKGVYWGLIVWVIKDISAGMFMVSFGASFLALTFIITGLPMWIVFGVILGAIYERMKWASSSL